MSTSFKAIIVDDEPAARRMLRSMLAAHQDCILISGEAGNGREAIELIRELRPDVVFLDIQLPDHTGFEVLEKSVHQPNIIFTTAYEEYAIRAFESFSIDYLLKPIREERLEHAIQKLKTFGKKGHNTDFTQLGKMVETMNAARVPTAFPIRQGDRILLIRFETIIYLEANDKYVTLFTQDGKKLLTDQTLTQLTTKLPPSFLRVQKSYIINKEKIREIYKHFNGRFVLVMEDAKQTRITTGLTFYETIKTQLGL